MNYYPHCLKALSIELSVVFPVQSWVVLKCQWVVPSAHAYIMDVLDSFDIIQGLYKYKYKYREWEIKRSESCWKTVL